MKQLVCWAMGWAFQQKWTQQGNQSPMQVTLAKGSCHRSYSLWRKVLSDLSFDLQSSKSGSVKRERKYGLLMHTSIPIALFSLWSSFSLFFIFLCFLFSILFLLLAFFCSPYCSSLPPFILPAIIEFTSFVPQPFLASCGHFSRTAHYPVGYPVITSTQSVLVAPLSISKQNYLSWSSPFSILIPFQWIRIKLPHHLLLWHASSDPNPHLPFFGWNSIPARHSLKET